MSFIVLVCGGRAYPDRRLIFRTLDVVHEEGPITLLVQGFAGRMIGNRLVGADRLADEWAQSRGVPSTGRKYQITPEMWNKYGRGAGMLRNRQMRDVEKPDLVLAFHGGNGTANMVTLAMEGGIDVIRIDKKGNAT